MKLLDGLDGCYRTVVADNFFTSISLAKYLLEHDMYLIGTLRKNRVGSGGRILEENLIRGEVYGLQNKDAMISLFDQLPDLTLLEIFSYLSCADALWSFSKLNSRLTTLLTERGFYRHVNLSSTGKKQFETIFSTLRLNEIQSLVIDRCTSPLQLKRWPHLTHLTALRLQGLNQADTFIQDFCDNFGFSLRNKGLLHRMESLHTFTFIKSFKCYSNEEWEFVNVLTNSDIMPVLRRINFSVFIDANDLVQMTHSNLFVDDRHIDVHYVFMISDDRQHSELDEYVPRGSLSHPRQIASVTFISECWPVDSMMHNRDEIYLNKPRNRQHIFYTLPWAFNEFFPLCVPDGYINELEVFTSTSPVNRVGSSHVRKFSISNNFPSLATSFPHIMSSNKVVELHLSRCDRELSVNLPIFDHLIITDSLDLLNKCCFSRNIRSIQITLNQEYIHLARNDWNDLPILSTLPFLNSLRILLYDMNVPPNDVSRHIIVETISNMSDFCFCFRRKNYGNRENFESAHTMQAIFITQLRNDILALPLNEKPRIAVEKGGYGLIAWF
ncbi:unnamed protein product [Rotaria sordida]|uniref:F-box domain-containing protein n=2 Tax=Rotaria sordida TaxID=392033 RepID=A0A819LNG7_9BILA|nr:unnamed protein product [Rotaria sordida]